MNILVLDVGTSSMRGTLMDERSEILFRKQVKYQPVFGPGGAVEQDAQDWVKAMKDICAAAAQAEAVDAIAITSQRSSVIPADCSMRPVAPALMWQDTRNRATCNKRKAQENTSANAAAPVLIPCFPGGRSPGCRRIARIFGVLPPTTLSFRSI